MSSRSFPVNRVFLSQLLSPKNRGLPLLVSWRLKWPFSVATFAVVVVLYLGTNHFALRDAVLLPLSSWDKVIPFLPWTIWIYVSALPYLITVLLLNRCIVSLNAHLYSFLAMTAFLSLIYLFFPVGYPRQLYPLTPQETDPWTFFLFNGIRILDNTRNCTPSLHVGAAVLPALGFLDDRREYFPLVGFWALLLTFSTLTTKQHYWVDVLLGMGVAALLFWVFHRWARYRSSSILR